MKKEQNKFSNFIEEYDLMINWEKRFQNESNFFKSVFNEYNIKSVLDCACSSGRHSQLFDNWGLSSYGCDIDPKAIDYAQKIAKSNDNKSNFFVAGLGELTNKFKKKVDAITILGNGLSFVPDFKSLKLTIKDAFNTLTNKGIMITQSVNYVEKLKQQILPLKFYRNNKEETLFIRYYNLGKNNDLSLNIIVLKRMNQNWLQNYFKFPMLKISKAMLDEAISEAGFKNSHFFSSFKKESLTKNSNDMITLSQK